MPLLCSVIERRLLGCDFGCVAHRGFSSFGNLPLSSFVFGFDLRRSAVDNSENTTPCNDITVILHGCIHRTETAVELPSAVARWRKGECRQSKQRRNVDRGSRARVELRDSRHCRVYIYIYIYIKNRTCLRPYSRLMPRALG